MSHGFHSNILEWSYVTLSVQVPAVSHSPGPGTFYLTELFKLFPPSEHAF